MHVTMTTIWESELRREDLLTMARQQQRANRAIAKTGPDSSLATGPSVQARNTAMRSTRRLLISLATRLTRHEAPVAA